MSQPPHRRTRRRSLAAVALALAASAVMTTAASAAPAPTSGSATIDGNPAEWDTTAPSSDFFSDMFRAAKVDKVVESKLYLRYTCTTPTSTSGTLYALVLAEQNVTIAANLPDDSYIKIGGTKYVDGQSGDDGTPPDFAWVGLSGATATGWEASANVAPGSYTINVHAQVNDGGLQTSAVPERSIPLVLGCGENPQPQPLQVTKTVVTSYERTFPWLITKSAAPASPVTTSADTQTFTYTVTATKGAPNDANHTVTGTIQVANPNATAIQGVDITDAIDAGPACTVTNGANRTIDANNLVTATYTCVVGSNAPGVNVATATWAGGASAGTAAFTFGAPSTVVNGTVDVTDAFDGGVPALLAGGENLDMPKTFTYTKSVPVPQTACGPMVPNTARIMSGVTVLAQATAMVQTCRTPPVILTPPATPTPQVTPTPTSTPIVTPPGVIGTGTPAPAASLKVTKRGPARASAGQVVTFTITVRNTNATTAATAVTLTDVLPAGYAIAKRPSGAVLQKGRLVWTIGDLAPGASKTVRVQVRIDRNAGGTRCNNAVASAGNATTVRTRACTKVVRIAGVTRIPIVTG